MVWIEISKKLADACSKEYMTDEEQRLLRLKLDLNEFDNKRKMQ